MTRAARTGSPQVVAAPEPTRPAQWAVELHGAGQVGGALLRLLEGCGFPVAAIHRRRGVERSGSQAQRAVFVDATPPAFEGAAAESWIQLLEDTLRSGTPVVTCNKAPLALAWDRLQAAAREGGVPLAATGTVGGGTPILPTLRGLREHRPVAAIEATLSGTLAVVVPLVKAGASLADAIAEAQRAGFCEPDPRLDLEGTDAWAKACILHNALWPEARPWGLADRASPLHLTEEGIRRLAHPAVVARITPGHVELRLRDWPSSSGSAATGIQLVVDADGGAITLSGPGAGPEATARALLADLQAIVAGRLAPGIGP